MAHPSNVGGKVSDEESIWISAVRYGLGRRTYITSLIADYMKSKVSQMSGECKSVMTRDLEECKDYGDDCDKEVWLGLLKELMLEVRSELSTTNKTL